MSNETKKVCSNCNKELEPEWSVCPYCQTEVISKVCANCQKPLEEDWQICPYCKTEVGPKICANCKKELQPEWQVCPYCKTEVGDAKNEPQALSSNAEAVEKDYTHGACGNCGEPLEEGEAFCTSCGARVDEGQGDEELPKNIKNINQTEQHAEKNQVLLKEGMVYFIKPEKAGGSIHLYLDRLEIQSPSGTFFCDIHFDEISSVRTTLMMSNLEIITLNNVTWEIQPMFSQSIGGAFLDGFTGKGEKESKDWCTMIQNAINTYRSKK